MQKKVIAYYLPQYHTFPENEEWWGKGFTEWTCVNRASSSIPEHRIKKPHPDIGYYSLLDPGIRTLQADLAKEYGIYGFSYYHYWFGGKVLMERIIEQMLVDNQPDLPFCLTWANEPWTRRMNGGDGETIQPTRHGGEQEWAAHLEYLLPFFKHRNYILVDNKPLFIIYRVSQIPNYAARFRYWNTELQKRGFAGIHVVAIKGNFNDDYPTIGKSVNGVVDFYPNFLWHQDMLWKVENNYGYYQMAKVYARILNDPDVHQCHYRGIMCGFDSSPRSPKRSNVFVGGTPAMFSDALTELLAKSKQEFVFVNAWNEWGEGCALEPEEQDGYGYLEAVRRAMARINYKFL